MNDVVQETRQKALLVNLNSMPYGSFAEIGAGQEVARWFFRVGGAAGTVAKTISAYDMAVSDALYGSGERYVSRERLEAMLEREFAELIGSLGGKRGDTSAFFAFATAASLAGVDAILVTDLIPEEAGTWTPLLAANSQMPPATAIGMGRSRNADPSDVASEIAPIRGGEGTSPSRWMARIERATAVARSPGATTT